MQCLSDFDCKISFHGLYTKFSSLSCCSGGGESKSLLCSTVKLISGSFFLTWRIRTGQGFVHPHFPRSVRKGCHKPTIKRHLKGGLVLPYCLSASLSPFH